MTKAIAVFASARRNGNTGKFIDVISHKLDMDVIDLSEKDISPYDYEHKNINDDFIPLMNELLSYDEIIFVTPIYWYGPSAQMKVFIDRTSDFLDVEELQHIGRKLRNKMAFIVCTSISNEADSSFLKSFKDTFEYLGMTYAGHAHANCKDGYIQNHYEEDVNKFVASVRREMTL
jgi:multimeric flavodoxin WrbA